VIVVGSSIVAAGREELWDVLSDPARLAEALPGVEAVSLEDERRFSAVARPRTALGETRLAMDFEILEKRASEYVRISAGGSAGEGLVAFTIELTLADSGAQTQASGRRPARRHRLAAAAQPRSAVQPAGRGRAGGRRAHQRGRRRWLRAWSASSEASAPAPAWSVTARSRTGPSRRCTTRS
jgi:carbon monoxide dehydrogenase subunit G